MERMRSTGGAATRKIEKPSLFVQFRHLEDPSKGHNSFDPQGITHEILMRGPVPLEGRSWGKKPVKMTGAARFRHGLLRFLTPLCRRPEGVS